LLAANPKLLELLVQTFDASRLAGDLLVRRPQLLEEITRDDNIDISFSLKEHLKRINSLGATAQNLDPLRVYRQTQLLRIVLRDVLKLVDLATLSAELSHLTEACLVFLTDLFGGQDLTIIALGKFGGREISYGADLDVLFLGTDNRAAQNLMGAMAQPSAEGNVAALDARLRPDGEKGPLVPSLDAYETYYRQRAQLWEIQALTRARPVHGPLQQQYIDMVEGIWRAAGQQPDLFAKIDNMLMRIRRDRSSGTDFLDFKTGEGGLIEAEFLVQGLQMRAGLWSPNWRGALDSLQKNGLISAEEAAIGTSSYEFLRRCESALRRREMKNISTLPADSAGQKQLAIRLGYENTEAFVKEYGHARKALRDLYDHRIKAAI
jgi:glutamate-ammonia-ligase adenylyltransferase